MTDTPKNLDGMVVDAGAMWAWANRNHAPPGSYENAALNAADVEGYIEDNARSERANVCSCGESVVCDKCFEQLMDRARSEQISVTNVPATANLVRPERASTSELTYTSEQIRAAIEWYESRTDGRTIYQGREPRHDEVLLATVKELLQPDAEPQP